MTAAAFIFFIYFGIYESYAVNMCRRTVPRLLKTNQKLTFQLSTRSPLWAVELHNDMERCPLKTRRATSKLQTKREDVSEWDVLVLLSQVSLYGQSASLHCSLLTLSLHCFLLCEDVVCLGAVFDPQRGLTCFPEYSYVRC